MDPTFYFYSNYVLLNAYKPHNSQHFLQIKIERQKVQIRFPTSEITVTGSQIQVTGSQIKITGSQIKVTGSQEAIKKQI